jgi:4-amino-4-deoxy-L-arabinose transferase-like glycosyltransferase
MKIIEIVLKILFFTAICIPIFLKLDMLPIQMWDESRNAISAMEMMNNGDWFVRHYIGAVDTWETKPVLLLWLQIIFFKLLGINVLAVRLPSALATLGIVIMIYRFFKNELKNIEGGVFAGLALIISDGFIRHHVSRTGDHDALLSFLLLWSLFEFYFVIKTLRLEKNKKALNTHFIRFSLTISAAVLTKSIVGFLWMPGFFIYALCSKNMILILKNQSFYKAIGIIVGIVVGYYGICEYIHPGHFKDVWRMELLPRYTNTALNYDFTILSDKWLYIKQITYEGHFFPLWQLLPICLLVGLDSNNLNEKWFTYLIISVASSFLAIISNGCANGWYDAPVYPLLAMLTGIGLSFVYKQLVVRFSETPTLLRQILYGFLFISLFFVLPYKKIFLNIYWTGEKDVEEKFGLLVKHLAENRPEWREYALAHNSYTAQFLFNMCIYNQKGYKLSGEATENVAKDSLFLNNLKIEQKIVVFQQNVEKVLQSKYEIELLYAWEEYKLYRILSRKPQNAVLK